MANFTEDLQRIKAFVFDIDGVLSKQTITLDIDGNPLRTINLRDGYALQLAVKNGYKVCVISGGNSVPFRKRLNSLGVENVYLSVSEKADILNKFISDSNLEREEVLYMGDDIPDYHVMKIAGVAVCPGDADNEIKQISMYISDKTGGDGCVRDVIEQVMRLHGKWMNNDAFIW
ncbi:MAG TPA: 3-deoxy-D-manno-octulosonate 8-phosphate phosphatase [Bacteroidetes bacterium]|nr:3-deoxy-D-manno-octulosonate 8-phosphate phosphatase [Bacteroidota bacterium]